ncbi:MAG: hypothetical protein RBS24_04410, partial [Bacilli bacterium]|nr:hypothetical protein [Bacilli bacterium]
ASFPIAYFCSLVYILFPPVRILPKQGWPPLFTGCLLSGYHSEWMIFDQKIQKYEQLLCYLVK